MISDMTLKSHKSVKNPFKGQNRPVDFSIMQYEKLTDVISCPTLQL